MRPIVKFWRLLAIDSRLSAITGVLDSYWQLTTGFRWQTQYSIISIEWNHDWTAKTMYTSENRCPRFVPSVYKFRIHLLRRDRRTNNFYETVLFFRAKLRARFCAPIWHMVCRNLFFRITYRFTHSTDNSDLPWHPGLNLNCNFILSVGEFLLFVHCGSEVS
jgi:hypothetical protein